MSASHHAPWDDCSMTPRHTQLDTRVKSRLIRRNGAGAPLPGPGRRRGGCQPRPRTVPGERSGCRPPRRLGSGRERRRGSAAPGDAAAVAAAAQAAGPRVQGVPSGPGPAEPRPKIRPGYAPARARPAAARAKAAAGPRAPLLASGKRVFGPVGATSKVKFAGCRGRKRIPPRRRAEEHAGGRPRAPVKLAEPLARPIRPG